MSNALQAVMHVYEEGSEPERSQEVAVSMERKKTTMGSWCLVFTPPSSGIAHLSVTIGTANHVLRKKMSNCIISDRFTGVPDTGGKF